MSKPHLYALMIGIDDYPIPQHRLNGCINDQEAIKAYFKKKIPKTRRHIKTLFNKKATRNNIITGFNDFKKAKAGDICVLTYSGHGSQSPAPIEFHQLESDQMNESIVCYDSRLEGGRDLMDKELGWLLWKASQNKEVHFLVIMDCCHSGSNTRNTEYKVRMATPRSVPIPAKNYLGFNDYIKTKVGRKHSYLVPQGNHVHLAGAKSDELAKELIVDGKARGIFTFSLLETLNQSGGQLSYTQLINQVRIKVFNRVDKQSPQVEGANQNQLFLGGNIQPLNLQVGYNGLSEKWQLNAGQLHGIIKGTPVNPSLLELENGKQVTITKVLPTVTELKDFKPEDYLKTYNARIIQMPVPQLKLAFTKNSTPKEKEILKTILKKEINQLLSIISTKSKAQFYINATEDGFQLLKRGETIPVFRSVKGTSNNHATDFLNKVKKVASWIRYMELSSPFSKIKDAELKIDFYKTTEAGNIDDDAPVKKVSKLNQSISLKYLFDGDVWHSPAFQTKLTNKSNRNLWVSVLYFSKDNGITNELLPKQELKPKENVWLRQVQDGISYRTISVVLDDIYLKQGVHEIQETLKVIISSDEFDTQFMCQEGLEQEVKRKLAKRKSAFTTDWTTKEISIKIIRKEK